MHIASRHLGTALKESNESNKHGVCDVFFCGGDGWLIATPRRSDFRLQPANVAFGEPYVQLFAATQRPAASRGVVHVAISRGSR